MVVVPGAMPAVFKVAEFPVPETAPDVEVQFATETGTPSGLVQFAVRLTVPPGTSSDGLADKETVGGFLGGSGLIVYFAVHEASFAFFTLGSVTCAVTA